MAIADNREYDREERQRGGVMSLKKRMFRSNMTILFSALLALMVILLAVLVLFEDTLEKQLGALGSTRVENHAEQAAQMLETASVENMDALQEDLSRWGYLAAAVSRGKVITGDGSGDMADLAASFAEAADFHQGLY